MNHIWSEIKGISTVNSHEPQRLMDLDVSSLGASGDLSTPSCTSPSPQTLGLWSHICSFFHPTTFQITQNHLSMQSGKFFDRDRKHKIWITILLTPWTHTQAHQGIIGITYLIAWHFFWKHLLFIFNLYFFRVFIFSSHPTKEMDRTFD